MRRDRMREEAGVAGTEYALIVGILWVMVFAIFPNLPPLWKNGFEVEKRAGEGQSALAQNLGLNLPNTNSNGDNDANIIDPNVANNDADNNDDQATNNDENNQTHHNDSNHEHHGDDADDF